MTWLGIKRRLAFFCVNHFLSGTVHFEWKRRLLNAAGMELGAGTKIVGPIFCTGYLKTGKDCWLGRELRIHGNGSVELGDRCDLAPEVAFLTGGHVVGSEERRAGAGETYSIRVGDGCWIGARATIGKSVTLGQGCVVGACACVLQNLPENTVAGGVPARVIRKLL